jgi:hypothetical protein
VIGFSTFFEKGQKNASFISLKLKKNKISKVLIIDFLVLKFKGGKNY